MARTNSFKTYERGVRQQYTEETFASGMQYTNSPLSEGYNKVVLNFDLTDDGRTLTPRNGFKFDYASNYKSTAASSYVTDIETAVIVDAKRCFEDKKYYDQFILAYTDKNKDSFIKVLTVREDKSQYLDTGIYPCYAVNVGDAEAHGLPVTDTTKMRTYAGTFAWDNKYHFFDKNNRLCYTCFDKQLDAYTVKILEPRQIDPSEAVKWGYNMLLDSPYTFTNNTEAEGFLFTGAVLTDVHTGDVVVNPKSNTRYKLTFYHNGSLSGKTLKLEYKHLSDNIWTELTQEGEGENIEAYITSPARDLIVKATVYSGEIVYSVYSLGLTFDRKDAEHEAIEYKLPTATAMAFWQDRLFIAGVQQDTSILFSSRTNVAEYFPYPNGADFFPEPIVNLVPFLETLLVFTKTKLYQLTMSEDGTTWTKQCIQENLNINPWDRHLTAIVKNMVYFKSGNYFYMVVPKANSLTGALTLAPITKNIKELLDNFEVNIKALLKEVYDYEQEFTLHHFYNYLDYEFIHNIYILKTVEGLYISVDLMYNSVKRYWKIDIKEISNFIYPLIQDATKPGLLVSLAFNRVVNTDAYMPIVCYYKYDTDNTTDTMPSFIDAIEQQPVKFKNYQFLDTGYREHNSTLKKRYRELQFTISNPKQNDLKFYSGFYIDGDTRKSYYEFEPQYNAETSEVAMVKTPIDPVCMSSGVILNKWVLGKSMFQTTLNTKLRIPVSGKGYCPRLAFVSYNETPFKLYALHWVYRILYSR